MTYCLDNEFYCVYCGSRGIPVVRIKGKERKPGHLKKLFCLKCKKETNHTETKECSRYSKKDFLFEYENGNFDNEGNRILSYGEFRDKMNKKGVELP